MAIYSGSRYEHSVLAYAKAGPLLPEVVRPVLFYYFTTIGTITYSEYEWKTGDRIDLVANKVYQNSRMWWVILEHNPEILDPTNIPIGTILRIPNV